MFSIPEWFQDTEWFETQAELDLYVLPLYLSCETGNISRNMMLGGIAGIVLSLMLFLWMITQKQKEKKRTKQLLAERARNQRYILIDGKSYPKATFDHVNELYRKSKKNEALEELCQITGLEKIDAKIIIDNWHSYYYI
ncbi:MAG: hypothetical protein J6C84_00680 [Lachnospiraceae bacterium]|nr:hypothetical protein [Lachnospiraceae bacterium]MBO5071256.1 hypothetical protein [Roseburia sp.]